MRLFPAIAAVFFIVPLIEIYLLIQVGGVIGVFPTFALVVLTAVAGAWLLRWQGVSTLMRLQSTMARGELPAVELMEGAVLLVGGALLLTPGFFTDTIGFLCLLPPARRALVQGLLRRAVVQLRRRRPETRPGRRVFEGEFRDLDEPQDRRGP